MADAGVKIDRHRQTGEGDLDYTIFRCTGNYRWPWVGRVRIGCQGVWVVTCLIFTCFIFLIVGFILLSPYLFCHFFLDSLGAFSCSWVCISKVERSRETASWISGMEGIYCLRVGIGIIGSQAITLGCYYYSSFHCSFLPCISPLSFLVLVPCSLSLVAVNCFLYFLSLIIFF